MNTTTHCPVTADLNRYMDQLAEFDKRIDFEEKESAELAEKWKGLSYIKEIDYDEDEIQFAMKEHGLGRDQMIEKLASDYVESNFGEINQL